MKTTLPSTKPDLKPNTLGILTRLQWAFNIVGGVILGIAIANHLILTIVLASILIVYGFIVGCSRTHI